MIKMGIEFRKEWKASSKPAKQRKYRFNAPMHIKRKFVSSHLSKELREKHGIRSIVLKKGDTVKIMRGKFKPHSGKVNRVDLKKSKVYVEGADMTKKDGTKIFYPLEPSNLLIITLEMDDKKRQKKLARKKLNK